jgi:hypothetical protein
VAVSIGRDDVHEAWSSEVRRCKRQPSARTIRH